jgi:hypothetical protein
MPVTAKLSKLFYERLGDQIVNELAEWLNQVDQSYRSELREMNEMNFARFDAKLEQRVAQLDAKIEQRTAHIEATMERRFGEQMRWMFAGWVTMLLAMIGFWGSLLSRLK